jgi:gamma-glutamylcyclotransferase (GGCT)/AIG2-like uncharacterized protein YtfP
MFLRRIKMATVELAVNGTLMRGLKLNPNMLSVGATFVREAKTAPEYRIWSIADEHPAMQRVNSGGVAVALEVWNVPAEGLASILQQEPPGLCIGKVKLDDGSFILGVLGEATLCEERTEISQFGGWRAYVATL